MGTDLDVVRATGPMTGRCLVCKSGYDITAMVNRLLVNGLTPSDIFRILSDMPAGTFPKNRVPSENSVRNHRDNHLPIKNAAYVKLLNKRAAERGLDIEAGADSILTTIGMAEVIAQTGFADIIEGKTKPNVKETIEAIKLVDQFEKEATTSFDAVAAMSQMQKVMEAIRKIVPEEMMEAIYNELQNTENAVIVYEDDEWPEED